MPTPLRPTNRKSGGFPPLPAHSYAVQPFRQAVQPFSLLMAIADHFRDVSHAHGARDEIMAIARAEERTPAVILNSGCRHILIKETLQTRNNELMPLGPVVIDPPDAPASA